MWQRQRARSGRAAYGVAGGLGLAALALVAIARMPDAPSPASELAPPPGVTGYAYTFSDLLTEADLIVAGTVSSTEPGRTVGEEASELQFLETTLAITSLGLSHRTPWRVQLESRL